MDAPVQPVMTDDADRSSGALGVVGGTPIDHDHLQRYTLGNAPLEREILGLFLTQLPLILESLRFATSDWDWQVAAHTLKGSARSVGATRVADLALEAEKGAGISDHAVREELLVRLAAAMADVEAYVASAYDADIMDVSSTANHS